MSCVCSLGVCSCSVFRASSFVPANPTRATSPSPRPLSPLPASLLQTPIESHGCPNDWRSTRPEDGCRPPLAAVVSSPPADRVESSSCRQSGARGRLLHLAVASSPPSVAVDSSSRRQSGARGRLLHSFADGRVRISGSGQAAATGGCGRRPAPRWPPLVHRGASATATT